MKIFNSKAIYTLIVALLICTLTSNAQKISAPRPGPPGSWRLIGTTVANFTADRDIIVVTGAADNFRALKFKVFDAGINMVRMVVTYDNGMPDKIDIRFNIPQGGESRVIDLKGAGKRSIRNVEFWYDTKGILRGKAKVQLWGMK